MSSDLNRSIQIGRLVRDPELKYTQSGIAVCSFSIASNYSYGSGDNKNETTSFFNCVAWGKLGEVIVQYCKKGHRIGIEGRLQQRSWEDKEGKPRSTVEIVVENFQFLTPKESGNQSGGVPDSSGNQSMDNPFSDSDIPF